MIVMMMAITPSENASRRPLPTAACYRTSRRHAANGGAIREPPVRMLLAAEQTGAEVVDVAQPDLGGLAGLQRVTAVALGLARARADDLLGERLVHTAVVRAMSVGQAAADSVGVGDALVGVGRAG